MPDIDCKECGSAGEAPTSKKSICVSCYTRKRYKELKVRYKKGIPDEIKTMVKKEYYDLLKGRWFE